MSSEIFQDLLLITIALKHKHLPDIISNEITAYLAS